MKNFRLIASLVISIALFSACSSLKKGSSSFDDSDSPYVMDDTTPKVKNTPKPKVESTIVVKEEKVKVIDQTESEIFKYYVIIGSFRVLENAQNYKKELISEGFTPVLLENENGLFRISVAAYNQETPSRDKIASIRGKYEKYSDVWLLIRKQ